MTGAPPTSAEAHASDQRRTAPSSMTQRRGRLAGQPSAAPRGRLVTARPPRRAVTRHKHLRMTHLRILSGAPRPSRVPTARARGRALRREHAHSWLHDGSDGSTPGAPPGAPRRAARGGARTRRGRTSAARGGVRAARARGRELRAPTLAGVPRGCRRPGRGTSHLRGASARRPRPAAEAPADLTRRGNARRRRPRWTSPRRRRRRHARRGG